MMSDGTRSAVHWMRASWPPMARAMMRASVVLPTPGMFLDQEVAIGEEADERVARRALHLDHRPTHGGEERATLVAGAHQGEGVQLVDHPNCIGWVMPNAVPPKGDSAVSGGAAA